MYQLIFLIASLLTISCTANLYNLKIRNDQKCLRFNDKALEARDRKNSDEFYKNVYKGIATKSRLRNFLYHNVGIDYASKKNYDSALIFMDSAITCDGCNVLAASYKWNAIYLCKVYRCEESTYWFHKYVTKQKCSRDTSYLYIAEDCLKEELVDLCKQYIDSAVTYGFKDWNVISNWKGIELLTSKYPEFNSFLNK